MTEDDQDLLERIEAIIANAWDEDEHETLSEARDRTEALIAENERLKYSGIHSCHDKCERPLCVLERENEKLRIWALKAFTVVEWVSGEGKLLSYPYYDADDLLGDGVELLGVYSSDDARAALGEAK
jgi:hypothetical protein